MQGAMAHQTLSTIRNDVDKTRRFLEMNRHAHEFWRPWQEMAEQSYQIMDNSGHWTQAEKDYLASRNRSPIIINKTFSPIMYVSGTQRSQRTEPMLAPTEVTDGNATALMQGLLRWVSDKTQWANTDSMVFLDKLICGLGWWKIGMDFSDKIEGEPEIERVRPFNVRPDPNFVTDGWKKCQYVFHDKWMAVDDAMVEFPKFKQIVRMMGSDNGAAISQLNSLFEDGWGIGDPLAEIRSFWDPQTHRVKMNELYYKVRVPRMVLIRRDPDFGDIRSIILNEEQAKIFEQVAPTLPPQERNQLGLSRRMVTVVRKAVLVGGFLMRDEKSPFTGTQFPLFPAKGYIFDKYPVGLVEYMKWPQKEKNARRSKMAEIIAKQPITGFFNKQMGGANPVDIDRFAKGVTAQIPYESVKPEEIKMRDFPEALVRADAAADADVGNVVGIDLQAAKSGDQGGANVTGRSLDNFQRIGLTAQGPLFDTFQFEKAESITFTINMIKQFIGGGRAMRILGARVLNDQEQDRSLVDLMTAGSVEDLKRMYSQAFKTEFDVHVVFKPAEPSAKMGLFKVLTDLAGNLGYPVPPEIWTDLMVETGMMPSGVGEKLKASQAQQQQAEATQALGGAAIVKQNQPGTGQVTDPSLQGGELPAQLLQELQTQGSAPVAA